MITDHNATMPNGHDRVQGIVSVGFAQDGDVHQVIVGHLWACCKHERGHGCPLGADNFLVQHGAALIHSHFQQERSSQTEKELPMFSSKVHPPNSPGACSASGGEAHLMGPPACPAGSGRLGVGSKYSNPLTWLRYFRKDRGVSTETPAECLVPSTHTYSTQSTAAEHSRHLASAELLKSIFVGRCL